MRRTRVSRRAPVGASAEMIQRWVCAALLEAAKKFRRIRGYRDLHRLVAALDSHSHEITQESQVAWN